MKAGKIKQQNIVCKTTLLVFIITLMIYLSTKDALADLIISGMIFGGIGFMMMFDETFDGFLGSDLNISTFDAVRQLSEQVGDDTVINIDDDNSITLKDVQKVSLRTNDFQFV
ncbi:hypothetical protein [Kiloniella sp. EL199]|uniref:hypothetical protein n=1 Tax=Kiloniella sp. EL199 TaxID=2107581 RepID=UPI000EA0A390|nr:hypothetical protein [Kiloniella sp. EL199]